jgi:hypothetical protein
VALVGFLAGQKGLTTHDAYRELRH